MLIQRVYEHKGWSDRIRRRGIRRVAKEAGIDYGHLSRIVNNQQVVTEKMRQRLLDATNRLSPQPSSGTEEENE